MWYSGTWFSRHGGGRLDSVILELFSNLKNSVILCPGKASPLSALRGLVKGFVSVSPAFEPSAVVSRSVCLRHGKLCVARQLLPRDPGVLPRKMMDFVYAKDANTNTFLSISFSR